MLQQNYTVTKNGGWGAHNVYLTFKGLSSQQGSAPPGQALSTLNGRNSSRVPRGAFKVTICLRNHLRGEIKTPLAGTQNYHRLPTMIMSLWPCQAPRTKPSATVSHTSLRHQIKQ